jgi:hypothetical protein
MLEPCAGNGASDNPWKMTAHGLDLEVERSQRGFELVRGDRQKLVARADRRLGFGVEARVVGCQRGSVGELLHEIAIALPIIAGRPSEQHRA